MVESRRQRHSDGAEHEIEQLLTLRAESRSLLAHLLHCLRTHEDLWIFEGSQTFRRDECADLVRNTSTEFALKAVRHHRAENGSADGATDRAKEGQGRGHFTESLGGNAFCITIVNRLIVVPIPRPRTIILRTTVALVVLTSMRDKRNIPSVATATVAIARTL